MHIRPPRAKMATLAAQLPESALYLSMRMDSASVYLQIKLFKNEAMAFKESSVGKGA